MFDVYILNNITNDQIITIGGLALNQYTLVSKTNTSGTINLLEIFVVKHGETQNFNIISNPTYKIKDVKMDEIFIGAVPFIFLIM